MVAGRVAQARAMQAERWERNGPRTNAEASLDPLKPGLSAEALVLAERAVERLRLSNRGFIRMLRVARSVADLAGSVAIGRTHVAEALAYRAR